MMITGFLKSTIGTGFISIGTTIIFMGLATPTYNENAVYVGITAMALGALIYFAGDIYKTEQKKKEVQVIDDRIGYVEEKTEEQIKLEAERVARHIVEEAEKEKQEIIAKKFREIELGVCGDLTKVCKDEHCGELPYCDEKIKEWQQIVSYPDKFPSRDIVQIARLKLSRRGITPTPELLTENIKCLHENQLISDIKCKECLETIQQNKT